jgi:hypothetical protein
MRLIIPAAMDSSVSAKSAARARAQGGEHGRSLGGPGFFHPHGAARDCLLHCSAKPSVRTTGAMNGKATDKTNAVLPGVTVTIASPSLMGTRTAVTGDDGTYRFPAIPPGDYRVAVRAHWIRYRSKHEGIRVALGFTATVNGELGVASLQEIVTVTGASPVVDTQSTAITTNFDARTLASLAERERHVGDPG